ncbi:MAG: protein kinase family protein, partial [Alphaproteobacteria bacterium]|nr:protein kinase family protein [Alphaproteobacteria bacterium]
MTFPIITDYKSAMRNAHNRLRTLDLRPYLDHNGEPVFMAGNFAAVFRTAGAQEHTMAVKCFIRDLPDLERRHAALGEHIRKSKASYFIDVEYRPYEIYVKSSIAAEGDYPVVVMPWVEGHTLAAAVEMLAAKNKQKGLAALTRAFAIMALDMLARKTAHGDLKHDNIIVTSKGVLKLIDYDSMYVPALKGLKSVLLGGVNFQHHARGVRHYGPTMDHFSILVIALSLRAITMAPELFAQHFTGENLILTHDDFMDPEASPLIDHLRQSPDFLIRDMTNRLIKSVLSSTIEVPGIDRALKQLRKSDTEPTSAGIGGLL